ncbi:hypothetical protein LTR84_010318 [Exophiala bonariae]|uniref:C2H2-type domain-containing protein n=1 Tax=Exophiala bonariae TaxID=1690606 RepID=A0AAV9MU44_9EURO|nr:hypothetical protein LTR84_010318 [Exophiala bonariae]
MATPTLSFTQKPTRPAPPVPDVQLLLKRLMENPNFDYYHQIIHDYLYADDHTWSILLLLRDDPTGLFSTHHRSTTQTPPQDIFQIISEIRNSANWGREKSAIVNRVNSGKRKQPFNGHPGFSHNYTRRPQFNPSLSASRVSQLRNVSNVPSLDYTCSDNLSNYVESSNRDAGSISVDGRKTAPDGWRFFCPSKNCKSTYARQGDYENHMDQRHAEFGPHNPQDSLKRISQGFKGGNNPQNEHLTQNAINNSNTNSPAPPFHSSTPFLQLSTPNALSSDAQHHQDVIPDLLHPTGTHIHLTPQDIEDPTHLASRINQSNYFYQHFVDIFEGQPFFPDQNIQTYMPQNRTHYDNEMTME